MLVVGERINATRKPIRQAIAKRDSDFVQQEAKRQVAAGAQIIDVNAGSDPKTEAENLVWLVKTVQAAVDVPLCVDSANAEALKAGVAAHKGIPLINSATAQENHMEPTLRLAAEISAPIVALLLDDEGIPSGVDRRLEIAENIVSAARTLSISLAQVYIDPLVQPVSTSPADVAAALDAMTLLKTSYPEIKTICGLSNVSFGLPNRALLNRTFLALMVNAGLDAAIMDPLEAGTMAALFAAEALLAKDGYCLNYIKASREGKLA